MSPCGFVLYNECLCTGHQDKPNVIAFHPLAKSVLASAGYDGCLHIWNVDKKEISITLDIKELVSVCYRYQVYSNLVVDVLTCCSCLQLPGALVDSFL